VVYTKPRSEDLAAKHLAQQGYEVFVPTLEERKRRPGGWQWVAGPLFPRYLFLAAEVGEQDLAPIRSTRGVVSLLSFGRRLACAPDALVAGLKALESPAAKARRGEAWPYRRGDSLKVFDGPFAGLDAVFDMPLGEERARVFIELLGRKHAVTLPAGAIS